jgi:hypothetical protein
MSYGSVATHGFMIFDEVRNGVYARALQSRITTDSVVLDLGAGLGLHGLVAAAAGARRVFLVETQAVVRIAMEIASANGLADRVVAIEKRIEDVVLPEQVDVIVSVLTGNLLFSEDLLPSLFHARDHFLKKGGSLLPDAAELVVAPVHAPAMHEKYVGRWSCPVQGLDYSAARRFACNEILWLRQTEVTAENLSPGQAVERLDLMAATHADCRAQGEFTVTSTGICHGLIGWIRLRLGSESLSTHPHEQAGQESHWARAFLPVNAPIELLAGETVAISLMRPHGGDWVWTIKAAAGTRSQSGFFAHPDGPDRLHRVLPQHRPSLGSHGRSTRLALTLMDGNTTNQQIAERLMEAEPASFPTLMRALAMVRSISQRYTNKNP